MPKSVKKHRGLNNKGLSLLEVIISVAIIGIVAVPLLLSFVSGLNNAKLAGKISKATYLSQSLIEQRTSMDYTSLLGSQATARTLGDGVYYTAVCLPSGPHDSLFADTPSYLHMVYQGSSLLIVGPDGQFTTVANGNFSLNVTSDAYILSRGAPILSGTKNGPLIVIINASSITEGASVYLSITGTAKAVVYAAADSEETFTVSPVSALDKTFMGIDDYSESMVKVRIEVYDSSSGGILLYSSEDTLTPTNPGR